MKGLLVASRTCTPRQTQVANPNFSCQGRFSSPWWLCFLLYLLVLPLSVRRAEEDLPSVCYLLFFSGFTS